MSASFDHLIHDLLGFLEGRTHNELAQEITRLDVLSTKAIEAARLFESMDKEERETYRPLLERVMGQLEMHALALQQEKALLVEESSEMAQHQKANLAYQRRRA